MIHRHRLVGDRARFWRGGRAVTAGAEPKEIQVSDSRLQFYGFFRQDVIFDGARVEAGHDARADQGDARVL